MSRALASAVCWLALTACVYPSPDLSDKQCDGDGRCAPGYTCVHNRCLADGSDAGLTPTDAAGSGDANAAGDAAPRSDAATASDATTASDAATTGDASSASDAATSGDAATNGDATTTGDAAAASDAAGPGDAAEGLDLSHPDHLLEDSAASDAAAASDSASLDSAVGDAASEDAGGNPPPHSWYVAADGSAVAAGTWESPWSLAHAASGAAGQILPGHRVILREGIYIGSFDIQATGTPGQSIEFSALAGEWAVLLQPLQLGGSTPPAVLTVTGKHVVIRGLELTTATTDRFAEADSSTDPPAAKVPMGACVELRGQHLALVHNRMHDCRHGIVDLLAADNSVVHGNLVFNIGWRRSDDIPMGRGAWIQNASPSLKHYSNNLFFNAGESLLHAEAAGGELVRLMLERNAFYAGQVVLAGEAGADSCGDLLLHSNHLYAAPLQIGSLETRNGRVELDANVMAALQEDTRPRVRLTHFSDLRFEANTLIANPGTLMAFDTPASLSLPYGTWGANSFHATDTQPFVFDGMTTTWTDYPSLVNDTTSSLSTAPPLISQHHAVPCNADPKIHQLHAFDLGAMGFVEVDLSGFLTEGESYKIYNAFDPYVGAVASGTYQSAAPIVDLGTDGFTIATASGGFPTATNPAPEFVVLWLVRD